MKVESCFLPTETSLTGLTFTKRFDASRRTIFTKKYIVGRKGNQLAQLKANARFVKPAIACGT